MSELNTITVSNVTYDIRDTSKVATYQGVSKNGNYMMVGSDGNITTDATVKPHMNGEILTYPLMTYARMSNKILIT